MHLGGIMLREKCVQERWRHAAPPNVVASEVPGEENAAIHECVKNSLCSWRQEMGVPCGLCGTRHSVFSVWFPKMKMGWKSVTKRHLQGPSKNIHTHPYPQLANTKWDKVKALCFNVMIIWPFMNMYMCMNHTGRHINIIEKYTVDSNPYICT